MFAGILGGTFALGLVAFTIPTTATAATENNRAGKNLKEVERALDQGRAERRKLQDKAADLTRVVRRLRSDMVTAALAIQDHEREVADLELDLADLRHSEGQEQEALRRNHDQIVQVLIGLQRIARNPPEAMIVQPLSPAEMVRSAILLRAVLPAVERHAKDLKASLLALARTREKMATRRAHLESASRGLLEKRKALKALFGQKRAVQRETLAESQNATRRVDALAAKAKDLRDLLTRLREARRQKKPVERRPDETRASKGKNSVAALTPASPKKGVMFGRARGRLPYPVVGRIVGQYGQATDTGLTRKGIVIETGPGAQVVAPHGGEVVFAGKFRGYGQLLIIEHGQGYHSLLAGLIRIDGTLGQRVVAGEPVGVMGRPKGHGPSLYLELRRNGQPINPLPWLAARKGKVSG